MKKSGFALFLLLAPSLSIALLPLSPAGASPFNPRDPISITGDVQMTSANGVTGGTGSANDPYIIEGWRIEDPAKDGIFIHNVTSHYVLRHLELFPSSFSEFDAFDIYNAPHGRIENVTFANYTRGAVVTGGEHFDIDGVEAWGVTGTSLNQMHSAINLRQSANSTISDSFVHDNRAGIETFAVNNVTISNVTSVRNAWGSFFHVPTSMDIRSSNFSYNNGPGILVFAASWPFGEVAIQNNTVLFNGGRGIAASSNNVLVEGNRVFWNGVDGLSVEGNNFTVRNNVFLGSGIGFYGGPPWLIDSSNSVNGLPVRALIDCSGVNLDGEPMGQLIVANCTDVHAENLRILRTNAGVQVTQSPGFVLANSTISGNRNGVRIATSPRSAVLSSNISGNTEVGLSMSGGYYDNVTGNDIASNALEGISWDEGYSYIRQNQIFGNALGLRYVFNPLETALFHNNFVANTDQAAWNFASVRFDDGYPSGGNFWSSYLGVDIRTGANQTTPGGPDGIGDTAYVERAGSMYEADITDRYPLMAPFSDEIAPLTGLFNITEGALVMSARLALDGWVSDLGGAGVARVEIRLDGNQVETPSGRPVWSSMLNVSLGPHLLEVRAFDGAGHSASPILLNFTRVTVPNTPPVAFFNYSAPPLTPWFLTFNGSRSYDSEDSLGALQFRWDFDGDGTFDTPWTSYTAAAHEYSPPDLYLVVMEVRDLQDEITATSKQILVLNTVNTPPHAKLAFSSGVGRNFTFDASNSTDAEEAFAYLEFRFDFNGDGAFERDWNHSPVAVWEYAADGLANTSLEARDRGGLVGRANSTITVTYVEPPDEVAPTVTIEAPNSTLVGYPITIRANATDEGSVQELNIFFRRDGVANFTRMPFVGQGPEYTVLLPPQSAGSVEFYVEASDGAGNVRRAPDTGYYTIDVNATALSQEPRPGGFLPGPSPPFVAMAFMAAAGICLLLARRQRK